MSKPRLFVSSWDLTNGRLWHQTRHSQEERLRARERRLARARVELAGECVRSARGSVYNASCSAVISYRSLAKLGMRTAKLSVRKSDPDLERRRHPRIIRSRRCSFLPSLFSAVPTLPGDSHQPRVSSTERADKRWWWPSL